MNPKTQTLIQEFHARIEDLQKTIVELNLALKQEETEKRTTVTFHSNPNRKIEDTSVLKKIEGGINEII
jgi:hypothetical protein